MDQFLSLSNVFQTYHKLYNIQIVCRKLNKKQYIQYLGSLYAIYTTLDAKIKLFPSLEHLNNFHNEINIRKHAEPILQKYLGFNWMNKIKINKNLHKYLKTLEKITNPIDLISHMYVRNLFDLETFRDSIIIKNYSNYKHNYNCCIDIYGMVNLDIIYPIKKSLSDSYIDKKRIRLKNTIITDINIKDWNTMIRTIEYHFRQAQQSNINIIEEIVGNNYFTIIF